MREEKIIELVKEIQSLGLEAETEKQKGIFQNLKDFEKQNNRLNDNPDLLAMIAAQTDIVKTLEARDKAFADYLLPESSTLRACMIIEKDKLVTQRIPMKTEFLKVEGTMIEINTIPERESVYPGPGDGEYFYANGAIHKRTGWGNYYFYNEKNEGIADSCVFRIIATSDKDKYPLLPLLTIEDLARK
jgi:hypothetical protein